MGPLTLRAWHLSQDPVRPGDPIQLDLIWQVRRPLQEIPALSVRFWGSSERGSLTTAQPLFGESTRSGLQKGDLIRTVHHLNAPITTGDHRYLVEVRLHSCKHTSHLPVGMISVADRPHDWQPPAGMTPVTASFDEVARLTGFAFQPDSPAAGDTLQLDLAWQALHPDQTSYKVFVHVIDEQGNLVAQHDSPPANNQLPTNIWIPDEYILDSHAIPLPDTLPPGQYTLRVGMYDPATGVRLPVSSDLPVHDNALDLTTITIGASP